jgi:hypothetical protein
MRDGAAAPRPESTQLHGFEHDRRRISRLAGSQGSLWKRAHCFSDEEWQSAVIDWISRARLIVMIAGRTPWVQWELRQIVRAGPLGKLLLLLPPGPAEDRRHRIELICEALDDRRLASADANLQRSVAVRFFAAQDPDRHQPGIVVVESIELTEVGYELGVRVATSAADQRCR